MKSSTLTIFGSFLLLLFVSGETNGSKVCYHAKTCIHNAQEKCGVNSDGEARRFLDSCDILEYNCLKGTSFQKASMENCKNMPPIPSDEKKNTKNTEGKQQPK